MKNILKFLLSLILLFALVVNTVSCDILLPYIEEWVGNEQGKDEGEKTFYIDVDQKTIQLKVGQTLTLNVVRSEELEGEIVWTTSSSCTSVEDGVVTAIAEGQAVIKASLGDKYDRVLIDIVAENTENNGNTGNGNGNNPESEDDGVGETITLPGTEDPVTSDPYVNVDEEEFYANYSPAISYMDAYYRTKHNLMSGSIDEQDQKPTISDYQPKSGDKLIRNNVYIFSEDGNTYYVVDCYGEIAFEIYKGGAYVILEEVAAYVFAFGEPPANHSYSKKTKPTQSEWGEYLRVNNTEFSGSTKKYPYEPMLPRISGCGGDLTYYEMDIGTTGTDCDPSYSIVPYNNGTKITRGAARIVYSCYDKNGNKIIDLDERYVFYTYNHYNDFQEYLNYAGGWGEMFGNVTGGGTLSSRDHYNPTPYVEVARAKLNKTREVVIVYCIIPKNELVA